MAKIGQTIKAILSAADTSAPHSSAFDKFELVEVINESYLSLLNICSFDRLVDKLHKEKLPFL